MWEIVPEFFGNNFPDFYNICRNFLQFRKSTKNTEKHQFPQLYCLVHCLSCKRARTELVSMLRSTNRDLILHAHPPRLLLFSSNSNEADVLVYALTLDLIHFSVVSSRRSMHGQLPIRQAMASRMRALASKGVEVRKFVQRLASSVPA